MTMIMAVVILAGMVVGLALIRGGRRLGGGQITCAKCGRRGPAVGQYCAYCGSALR